MIGHAGAIVSHSGKGNATDKINALRDAGVVMARALPHVGITLQQVSRFLFIIRFSVCNTGDLSMLFMC